MNFKSMGLSWKTSERLAIPKRTTNIVDDKEKVNIYTGIVVSYLLITNEREYNFDCCIWVLIFMNF